MIRTSERPAPSWPPTARDSPASTTPAGHCPCSSRRGRGQPAGRSGHRGDLLAWNEASAGRGAFLMAAYCLGLGLPFVCAALAFRRALDAFGWVKRHYVWVLRTGGGMLVLVGVLLACGIWSDLVYVLQRWAADTGGAAL
ncbi:cytochrome c biogenesis protein CcdA [Streptomyces sp. NPDC051211]|uniref:cytochrome c biogenesis CcdA family protein n=1 Tax=Streptomyces sp. NPDC051211 TaxID=3154643 RepID=UPI00344CDB34